MGVGVNSGGDPAKGASGRQSRLLMQYGGLGLELGGGLAGCVLLGWWLDSTFKTAPIWLVTFATAGCIGGLYNLIRRATQMQKEFERASRPTPPGPNEDDADREHRNP